MMDFLSSSLLGNALGLAGIIISLQIKKKIDDKNSLIKKLVYKTKQSTLYWKNFYMLDEKESIVRLLEEKGLPCDYGNNTIRESQSYYINNNDGYILLLELYHGDPAEMSPKYDTLGLLIVTKEKEVCSLSDFEKVEQKKLKELKHHIQSYNNLFGLVNEIMGDN